MDDTAILMNYEMNEEMISQKNYTSLEFD